MRLVGKEVVEDTEERCVMGRGRMARRNWLWECERERNPHPPPQERLL